MVHKRFRSEFKFVRIEFPRLYENFLIMTYCTKKTRIDDLPKN